MLGRALSCPVFDLDEAVEDLLGQAISAFVEQADWPAFRLIECETFARLLQADQFVIACGAGLVETELARNLLSESCDQRLWLDITPAQQVARLSEDQRPRLNPELSWQQELLDVDARRRPLYQQLATAHLAVEGSLTKLHNEALTALE